MNGATLLERPHAGFWIYDPDDGAVLATTADSWTWHSFRALTFETRELAEARLAVVRVAFPRAMIIDAKPRVFS